MAFNTSLPAIHGPEHAIITTFLISNLHCPTCVTTIESSLAWLHPTPLNISSSILSQSVTVTHDLGLSVTSIQKALEDEAFEIHSVVQDHNGTSLHLPNETRDGIKQGSKNQRRGSNSRRSILSEIKKRKRHISQCGQCQVEMEEMVDKNISYSSSNFKKEDTQTAATTGGEDMGSHGNGSTTTNFSLVVVDSPSVPVIFRVTIAIGGMTCSSCVGAISDSLGQHSWMRSIDVNLLTNSASVSFEGKEHLSDIVRTIEDLGYDARVDQIDDIEGPKKTRPQSSINTWRATYSIFGMTCSSCVGTITNAVQQHNWVETVEVNLVSDSAIVVFKDEEHLQCVTQAIEDLGYEATLNNVVKVDEPLYLDTERKIAIRVGGMHCSHCPPRVSQALKESFGEKVYVESLPTTSDPILRIRYTPHLPNFTIRQIIASIAASDATFELSIYHPPSLEERSQEMRAHEQLRILLRLALSVVVAIPTFIVGIVLMTLVDSRNPTRGFIMEPMWVGNVSRAEWALFIMATPIYFFAADVFHIRTLKGLWAMWRPRSTIPIIRRFYRFGSMDMLISLGTTVAYFSSITELAIAAGQPVHMASMGASSSYFDSVVFLTMFLLIGRFIEAYSKAKTGDAVTMLGKLMPTETILVESTKSSLSPTGQYQAKGATMQKINVDLLEAGDVVKVLHGSTPPSDGIIIEGETQFDESSLTGESRLVSKRIGDEVFAGTINKANPISVRISSVAGTSMLDHIVKAVRDGQAKRAPIERVADLITGHFVPVVVLMGISTWIIWLALGLSGVLPEDYRDTKVGGWPLWSLQFSIAVFVIACPCGIGLAAPTALFVGGGLAAENGILAKGGGEAFQEASRLDCVVFDKTGTLTEGGQPSVTGYKCLSFAEEKQVLGMVKELEESSHHPVAKAIVSFCHTKEVERGNVADITEIPGKGMSGIFSLSSHPNQKSEIIIGNESFMSENEVFIDHDTDATLATWKEQGKSVALFAMRILSLEGPKEGAVDSCRATAWKLLAVFAASDKIRPEAATVIATLKLRGIEVWMISGDNAVTAKAVGTMVGISEENVIAGVLPYQKAEKIQHLQKTSIGKGRHGPLNRSTVAMVGDGINDSSALTMADVGIAIGSGSDIAISSAEFVLMSSSLTSVLVLIDLSRTVFRRVRFNFFWAIVYNVIALPVAAGVLYSLKSNGSHIRLDPVWASLAMALSSVSVVCSSLLMRSKLPIVGFRSVTATQKTSVVSKDYSGQQEILRPIQ